MKTQNHHNSKTEQSSSTQQPTKTTTNPFNYEDALSWLQKKGVEIYGSKFQLHQEDRQILCRLICYMLQDETSAIHLNINLQKGVLLTGPVGCGKTTLMNLLKFFQQPDDRYILKSCRDVSFEFIQEGYETIHKYSHKSFNNHQPKAYCFDDLGTENNLKYYGNECNVMAEILLSRYDQYINRGLITHLTTNLSASEIETIYGNRIRSRLREMMNLNSFEKTSKDKRQ
jgi:predicted ATPase